MKNRTELAKYFAQLGFTKGAEIGVYAGYYSKVLLDNIPGLSLLSIDPYHRRKVHVNVYHEAVRLLKDYPGSIILKGFSWETSRLIPDNWLDFVYIDGDHTYNHIKGDIEKWTPKVRSGGIVSGHDYAHSNEKNIGVWEAVNEYVQEHDYKLMFTDWDNESEAKDNRQPSWYFLKEKDK